MEEKQELKADKVIELEGIFLNARNEITQPTQGIWITDYFLCRWLPELGGNLLAILMQLRRHCLRNCCTAGDNNGIYLSLAKIIKETGLSESTIRRELHSPTAKQFIKVCANYKYDETLHKKIRTPNKYQVLLDDPIHPADKDKFLQIKDKRSAINAVSSMVNDLPVNLTGRSPENKSPTGQIDRYIYAGQIDRHIYTGQFDRVSTNVNVNTLNVNVQGKNVNVQKPSKQETIPLTHHQEALVEKILSITKDPKSKTFYRQVAIHCSQANIENAIEDIKTYAASGRKVKNPGALFTSRIKNLDPYFQRSKQNKK